MQTTTTAEPARALDTCEVLHAEPERVAEVQAQMPDPATVDRLAEIFKVLGDPTRVRILTALSTGELCVCDLATLLRVSESAVSHQLRLLRSLRLVRARRDGRMVFYRLDDHHIVGLLRQGREHVEEAGQSRSDR
jgi:ArsR family transcriptional regulator, lead/cadmium/zinc/bismuth-responsive transcriptional repressor